jgi:hypothetical protein
MTTCAGCGATGIATQACALCRSEGLPPCHFCSEDCLAAAWHHHKEWHREQRRLHALAMEVAAKHWSADALAPCSPYDELLAAMGGDPTPVPAQGSDVALAVATFVELAEHAERTEPGTHRWAERCLGAYALMCQPDCPVRATWWNDAALCRLSERVLAARPDSALAWRMRGEVLSARLGRCSWRAGPRSAEELEEAGRAIQRALALGGHDLPSAELSSTDKETLVRQALACFRAAQTMRDAG